MQYSEELIVEQLKQGHEDAYKYLYDHHYTLLCCIANEYVKDSFISETIVGDVIFHLWEIRDSLEITSIRSYLVRAVRNRCINYLNLKREKYEISFSYLLPEKISEEKRIEFDNYPLGTLLERELENQINKAIDKLPEESRRVFKMSRFEEKKYEVIAQELGISVNTVKYHMKNALMSLRRDLGKYLITLLLLFCNIVRLK
jgi:RNA polymerase sigma-70 factor (ECF subfamily)